MLKLSTVAKLSVAKIRCFSTLSSGKLDYRPRRACLYVPGNDMKKIKKLTDLEVDCAILDCEDGVAINRKEEARHTIKQALDEIDYGSTEATVRVNALSSEFVKDDLHVLLSANKLPSTLMLPKVETSEDLLKFSDLLTSEMAMQDKSKFNGFNLVIFIESAMGMLNLPDICKQATLMNRDSCPFSLQGLVFGSDDFCADIGATRTSDGKELLYARQKLVLVAKAYGLQAIDMVHIDYKDTEGLHKNSVEGSMMGFTGKQCIHPGQVSIVQKAFTPSPDKIEWANELIKAFNEHQSSGKGAFTFRGHMIDMPLLLQAKNIVKMSETFKIAEGS